MWCLNPTSESDRYWQNYWDNNPDDRDSIASAQKILKSANFSITTQSSMASAQLWDKIEEGMQKLDAKKKKSVAMRYVAAVVVALVIVAAGVFVNNSGSDMKRVQTAETEIVEEMDVISTEIVLIKDNKDVVEIENNALIEYDNEITIQTEDSKKTIASKSNNNSELNKLIVPYGRHTSIVLSDGSRIWLNAGSVIKFPTSFDSHERRIYVEGEIYIEVVKDSIKPFLLETSNMNVNVLGTKFSVSAYAEDATHSVVLVEGKVNVATDATTNYTLSPNQKLSYTNSQANIEKVDALDYVSWKDGVFQLRNNKMDEVAQRLSRYYNTAIKCSEHVTNKRLSGKLLLFDDINQVMQTFSMLYDVNYRLESEGIVIE